MPLAAWRENSSRHVASLRRIRLVFFIAPVSSTITGRDYPQRTDLRKYLAELPVTAVHRPEPGGAHLALDFPTGLDRRLIHRDDAALLDRGELGTGLAAGHKSSGARTACY